MHFQSDVPIPAFNANNIGEDETSSDESSDSSSDETESEKDSTIDASSFLQVLTTNQFCDPIDDLRITYLFVFRGNAFS